MAVVVESTGATSSAAGANSIAVAKPTGLTEGELMIAHVFMRNGNSLAWSTVPSGWTEATKLLGSNAGIGVWWKIATAGDVSATDFTWGWDGAAVNAAGRIWRLSGHDTTTPVDAANSASGGAGTTITVSGITPSVANCLLMLFHGASDDTGLLSNWAIATDNPASWTEAYDEAPFTNERIGAAYAERAATTATGNATWTQSSAEFWGGAIVAVAPAGSGGGGGGEVITYPGADGCGVFYRSESGLLLPDRSRHELLRAA